MKKFTCCIISFMLLVTGCSDGYFSSTIDLAETTKEIVTETTTESIVGNITMTTNEQYTVDNEKAESDCSAILKELPSAMKGKWIVGEEFSLKTIGRIGEEKQGNIIEFSEKGIKVNGKELQNPFICQDEVWDYDFLFKDMKWNVWKIGMGKEDHARYIVIEGQMDSYDNKYFIPILYFDEKPYLMDGCGYYMEKYTRQTGNE